MATLTESEMKEKLKTAFTDNSISGDLVDMMSTFAARFLYLEQYITAGIVMEGSFSRCVKLNSRITHAADNFYSVQRGNCRKVQLQGVTVLESISATKYDVINTYGDYKLVYASDYALAASNTPTTIDCLVTLGTKKCLFAEISIRDEKGALLPVPKASLDGECLSVEGNEIRYGDVEDVLKRQSGKDRFGRDGFPAFIRADMECSHRCVASLINGFTGCGIWDISIVARASGDPDDSQLVSFKILRP